MDNQGNSSSATQSDAAEERELHLRVQTPRGIWDQHSPAHAKPKPNYRPSALVQQVIDDVRSVFGFVEQDSVYTLFGNGQPLNPRQSLQEAGVRDEELLVLTVQGGNA